jgi:hypothetical protein
LSELDAVQITAIAKAAAALRAVAV